MDAQNDHPRSNAIQYIRIFQIFVAAMDIAKPIANLDLRRQDKAFKKEIETDAEFGSIIILFNLHQFFGSFCTGVGSHVDCSCKTCQGINPEIANPI